MAGVAITDKINDLLDKKVGELGTKTKEGLVHAIFLLALTDEKFLQQAQKLNRDYFGELGGENLEKVEGQIEKWRKQ